MKETDVLVIGGGPAGYVAAIRAGQLGKSVVLADKGGLGGECLHQGCIPSKAFIHAAEVKHKAEKGSVMGVAAEKLGFDMSRLQAFKGALVGGLSKGVAGLLKSNRVEFIEGAARLTGPGKAEIAAAQGPVEVAFGSCILATGSKTIQLPGFEFDAESVLGSREALDLNEIPPRLAVIGGGVIGLELGTFFAKLGSKVTVIEMLDQILPGMEPDVAAVVARTLQKLGVELHVRARAKGWEKTADGLLLKFETSEGEQAVAADRLLVSIGRSPQTEGLGLEAAGVETTEKGFLKVDAHLRTSTEGIYAVGDVNGPPFLAHKGSREGVIVAEGIAAGQPPTPISAVPLAIFTDPEVAVVGLTEAEAKAQGMDVLVGKFPFAASGRAQSQRATDGFVRVVAERELGIILGTTIVGPYACELISEACLAVQLQATVYDVAATIHPHPTFPEAFLEACEAAAGHAIHTMSRS